MIFFTMAFNFRLILTLIHFSTLVITSKSLIINNQNYKINNNKNNNNYKVDRKPKTSPTLLHKCQTVLLSTTLILGTQFAPTSFLKTNVNSNIHSSNTLHTIPMALAESSESSRSTSNNNPFIDTNGRIDSQLLRQALVDPTDDHPQIQLQSNNKNNYIASPKTAAEMSQTKQPIVQGLVYIPDNLREISRPNPNDVIVFTIAPTSQPDNFLAGAKFIVAKARFPFQFQLYTPNILKEKLQDFDTFITDDYVVNVQVCDEASEKFPCSEEETTWKASGVAKVVRNLPGMREGDFVRTPAALPLSP